MVTIGKYFLVFRYKWDKNEKHLKPETGLLQLREGLKVFANLRPASVLPQVINLRWGVMQIFDLFFPHMLNMCPDFVNSG